jgi:hypothetical protein
LRKNSVKEAATVGDIQTQQVLDNLAMFVCNPNAMPYFSFPNQSSAGITDTGSAAAAPSFARTVSGILTLSLSRQAQEGFVVTPVNDPRKLELMRCAYQKAVASCCGREPSTTCPDCQTRFKMFYTGDPNGDIRANVNLSGAVTSECLKSDHCWFHVGCEKCAHKCGTCDLIGHYCGVYVWVGPEGRDELTKLTLAILDFAYNSQPVQLTKQVVYYLDAYGLPTTQVTSVGMVTATVGVTEQNQGLLNTPRPDEARIEQALDYRLRSIRERLDATKDADERTALLGQQQLLQDKLDFLHEQLRVGGLKEQYHPSQATSTGSGILGLQQGLNILAPPSAPVPQP